MFLCLENNARLTIASGPGGNTGRFENDPNVHLDPANGRYYRHDPQTGLSTWLDFDEQASLSHRQSAADEATSSWETAFQRLTLEEPEYVHAPAVTSSDVAAVAVDYNTSSQDLDVPAYRHRATLSSASKTRTDPRFVEARGPRQFFQPGRVIKVLWPELAGVGDDATTTVTLTTQRVHDERRFEKIRRFIVVKAGRDSCLCIPIATYQGRGVAKRGVLKRHHCIVYTGRRPPRELHGESRTSKREDTMLPPLRIIPSLKGDYMEPETRLNFGKTYTVKHNVPVQDFGMVDSEQIQGLVRRWQRITMEPDSGNARPAESSSLVSTEAAPTAPFPRLDPPQAVYVDLGEATRNYAAPAFETRQLSLEKGDRLSIIEWPYDDWAQAYNMRTSQTGLVPLQYINLYRTATAQYDYEPNDARGYVQIARGDGLRLIEERSDGWSLVWRQETAEIGLVPSNYIEKQI